MIIVLGIELGILWYLGKGSIDKRSHCIEASPPEMWLAIIFIDGALIIVCIYSFIKPIYLSAKSIESCTHQNLTKNLAKRVIGWYVNVIKSYQFFIYLR